MISFTDNALQHIKRCLENRKRGVGIRVGLKKTGCSGMAYKLEFADNVAEDEDNVSSSTDIVILVKHKDFPYLDGMVVDYVKNGLTEGLDFQNPNIKAKCGCGESFQV